MRGIVNKCTKINWDNNFKPVGENDVTDLVSEHIADIIDDKADEVFAKENTVAAIQAISGGGETKDFLFTGIGTISAHDTYQYDFGEIVNKASTIYVRFTGTPTDRDDIDLGFTFNCSTNEFKQNVVVADDSGLTYGIKVQLSNKNLSISIQNLNNIALEGVFLYFTITGYEKGQAGPTVITGNLENSWITVPAGDAHKITVQSDSAVGNCTLAGEKEGWVVNGEIVTYFYVEFGGTYEITDVDEGELALYGFSTDGEGQITITIE